MNEFTHLDERGQARMVDVGGKADSLRRATASGRILLQAETVRLLRENALPKGDALAVARVAGIMAAKRTAELIPMCHPVAITGVKVDIRITEAAAEIEAEVSVTGPTGVEMEALTAVSVAALALYDMVKSVDRAAIITDICLRSKSGGKSGAYVAADLDKRTP